MSLNKEIKELDVERLEEGKKSRAHYAAIDLPGERKNKVDQEAARQRIAAMRKEREDAQQGEVIK